MPTIKQKVAFKEVLNGSTITSAMKKANYSDTTASTTGKLTNTKGWKELVDQHLPDKLLAQKHNEGLNAGKHIYKNNNETGEIEDLGIEADYATRHKYLDSAYKIKGAYAPEKSVNVNINTQFSEEEKKSLLDLLGK